MEATQEVRAQGNVHQVIVIYLFLTFFGSQKNQGAIYRFIVLATLAERYHSYCYFEQVSFF